MNTNTNQKTFFLGNNIKKIDITTFLDGEIKAQIVQETLHKETTYEILGNKKISLEKTHALLSHSLNSNDAIIELCLILNVLSYEDSVEKITLIIPYMRFSRQDRQNLKGESISAVAILRMITAQTKKIKSISFYDIHNPAILNALPCDITYKNVIPLDVIQRTPIMDCFAHFFLHQKISTDDVAIVACDVGGINRARIFSKIMCTNNEISIIHKRRIEGGGLEMSNIIGESIENKICIIVDDIVDSADTLCKSAELLKEKGATKIYAFITHGVFSGDAIEKINNSPIEKLFVTNSNIFDHKDSEKIEVCNIPDIESTIWFN